MDLGLRGKKAIVTGATRGIGRAIVEQLAAEGADIGFCARNEDEITETTAALKARGVKVAGSAVNVRDGDAYKAKEAIPQGLRQALDLFDSAKEIHDVLGPEFARVYSIVKRTENDEFLQVISPWEREHLLLNV